MKEIIRHLHNSLTTTHYACAYHCQNIQAPFVMHVYIYSRDDKHDQYSGWFSCTYTSVSRVSIYPFIPLSLIMYVHAYICVSLCTNFMLFVLYRNVQCTRANHCQGGRVHAVKSTIRPIRASIKTLNLCIYFTCTRPPFRS